MLRSMQLQNQMKKKDLKLRSEVAVDANSVLTFTIGDHRIQYFLLDLADIL